VANLAERDVDRGACNSVSRSHGQGGASGSEEGTRNSCDRLPGPGSVGRPPGQHRWACQRAGASPPLRLWLVAPSPAREGTVCCQVVTPKVGVGCLQSSSEGCTLCFKMSLRYAGKGRSRQDAAFGNPECKPGEDGRRYARPRTAQGARSPPPPAPSAQPAEGHCFQRVLLHSMQSGEHPGQAYCCAVPLPEPAAQLLVAHAALASGHHQHQTGPRSPKMRRRQGPRRAALPARRGTADAPSASTLWRSVRFSRQPS